MEGPQASKGRKAIHRKMDESVCGKQRFAGPHRDNGTREELEQALLNSHLPPQVSVRMLSS